MPNSSSPPSVAAPASLIDSRQAAWRLLTTLGLVVLGNSSMYVVSVVLPAVQAEFGVGRADASLPYTLMMVCLGLGGIWTGRMADRHGLMPVLCVGAVAVCGGFVWAGLSGSIWGFGLAHGLMGLIGSSATFAPLMADTALWWNKRRGIAVAICASGNYIAGALWPPIVQHGIETIGWRQTYILLGMVCGLGMLVLHDDAQREFAYGPATGLPESKVGTFTQSLYDEAKAKGWSVISIKKDWKRVFAYE